MRWNQRLKTGIKRKQYILALLWKSTIPEIPDRNCTRTCKHLFSAVNFEKHLNWLNLFMWRSKTLKITKKNSCHTVIISYHSLGSAVMCRWNYFTKILQLWFGPNIQFHDVTLPLYELGMNSQKSHLTWKKKKHFLVKINFKLALKLSLSLQAAESRKRRLFFLQNIQHFWLTYQNWYTKTSFKK